MKYLDKDGLQVPICETHGEGVVASDCEDCKKVLIEYRKIFENLRKYNELYS